MHCVGEQCLGSPRWVTLLAAHAVKRWLARDLERPSHLFFCIADTHIWLQLTGPMAVSTYTRATAEMAKWES